MEAVLVIPPVLAVITAITFVLMVEALAVKVADTAPAPTETLVGVFKRLLPDVSATGVADEAGFVRVTVHKEDPPEPSVVGLHTSPESWGGVWEVVMLPPVPDAGMELPSVAAANVPVS
jgi:hypothetical protein